MRGEVTQFKTKNPSDKTYIISIPDNYVDDFKTAMKIGYYKILRNNNLISDNQLETLMKMQFRNKFA